MTTTELAKRSLTDEQIKTRIDLNKQAGWGLEKGTPAMLNMIFLYCQKHDLLPGDDVTLYDGRVWTTIDGRMKLLRRHPEYRGFSNRPLTKDEKTTWGYDVDDIVVECTIRTTTWGDIAMRGKVSAAEAQGVKVDGQRHNFVARMHPVEMAEKRAMARAERAAFGTDAVVDDEVLIETERTIIQERKDPARVARLAAKYDETIGQEDYAAPDAENDAAVAENKRLRDEALEARVPNPNRFKADRAFARERNEKLNEQLREAIQERMDESDLELAGQTELPA